MPFTADQILNKRIFAKFPVKKLNSSLQEIGNIPAGPIGVVFSWIVRNGKLYWMIGDDFRKGAFLVQHNSSTISLDASERREIEAREKQKKEDEQKKQKGVIPFYIEKYGKTLLLFALASIAIREYIKKT